MPLLPVGLLPTGVTSYNIYLTDSTGNVGSGTRYISGITGATLALTNAVVPGSRLAPVTNAGSTGAVVSSGRGGSTGGNLPAGSYFVQYTFAFPNDVESFPSPVSNVFTQAAGSIPQVSMPPLPAGALGYNIYLSDASATPGTATRYASLIATPFYNLVNGTPVLGVNHPASFSALTAPSVVATGGGSIGGTLAPGNYFLIYSFIYATGAESLPSPSSNAFSVNAGNVPQVALPPLPNGATGYNVYLSNASGTPGSANRYAARVTAPLFNLSSPAPVGPINPTIDNFAIAAPPVNPTGGGSTGGSLLPGTYFAYYTFLFPSGTETFASPNSLPFTVAAGNVPQIAMPALPLGATSYRIYLSDDVANAGSARLYAAGVTSSPYNLGANALAGRTFPQAVNAWTAIPIVNPTGAGSSGGSLASGTYFVYYTFSAASGLESFPSANSMNFTVATGNRPTVALPTIPAWATGINLYISNPLAQAGSEILYASGINATSYTLSIAGKPADNSPVPLVNATGGNGAGTAGTLATGTYFVFFTFNNAVGSEVYASASSAQFAVASLGDVPRVTLPTLPLWASSFNIYVSNNSAGLGSATPYAFGITTPVYDLAAAQHSGGVTTLLVGDDFTLPADAQMLARQRVIVRGDFADTNPAYTASNDPDMGTGVTMNIFSGIVAPNVLLQGEGDNDTFNVQVTAPGSTVTFDTGAGANVLNFGSRQTTIGGIADNLQGYEFVLGSGNDTLNIDDTASPGPKNGFFTAIPTPSLFNAPSGTITGLNMGPLGFNYNGLSNLNAYLGSGGTTLPLSPIGNSVNVNVPAGLNLPATTTIFAGTSNNDRVTSNWGSNHNTILNLYQFESGTATVGNDVTGTVNFGSGTLQTVTVANTLTPGSILNASNIDAMTVGPNAKTVGKNLAGQLNVLGRLGSLRVAGGTPGSISAGSIGTIGVFGGYGPVVGQIRENGIARRLDADLPNIPYPLADETYLPSASGASYVNFQYFYEGQGTGLYNPQLTTRIVNPVSAVPDQFDLNLMTYNNVAKFNLARVDASGISGVRNVSVEGDLLTSVTSGAQAFIGLPTLQGGVRLSLDDVAGVEIRDFAPQASIQAKSLQAVAFGSTLRTNLSYPITGTLVVAQDGKNLLVPGTAIAIGGSTSTAKTETYRVPFADLPTQNVTFYLATGQFPGAFDNANILFQNQANNGVRQNRPRGADSALIAIAQGSYSYSPNTISAIVQTLDLRGDGSSFVSNLFVARSITSTGALGNASVNQVLGIVDLSAPSIFGNVSTYGPISGLVQTTGIRVDPVAGTASTASADFGRVYVTTSANGSLAVTSTTIQTDANGRPPASIGAGIMGRLIVRGNLLSKVVADGGINGTIAVEGDIGAFSTLLSIASPTRVGGIATDYSPTTGKIIGLGRFIGDLSLLGGLLSGGTVAIRGSILGNSLINGIGANTILVSGGTIGDAALGTAIAFTSNQGIIAAKGAIANKNNTITTPGYYFNNVGNNADGNVIDALFADLGSLSIAGLDYSVFADLGGLNTMIASLGRLRVVNGHLVIT